MMNVLDYLENAAKVNPDRVALEDGNGKLTYKEYRDLARKVGLFLMEKGYHNTNTAEIAKVAGVSTGIVYNYFKDKHDILIEGIKIYANDIFYPMLNLEDLDFSKEANWCGSRKR